MKSPRYDLKEDPHGCTVFDIWTGAPVIVHGMPQIGLEVQDADELAEALSLLSDHGDREVRQ